MNNFLKSKQFLQYFSRRPKVYNFSNFSTRARDADNERSSQIKENLNKLYRVMRIDDNGNEFEIEKFQTHREAEKLIEDLTRSQHKQHYWIEDVPIDRNEKNQANSKLNKK